MFELIVPMAVIPSNTELATDLAELDDIGNLFDDEELTNSQQILDSLFAGMED
jgi:hypothetical protein